MIDPFSPFNSVPPTSVQPEVAGRNHEPFDTGFKDRFTAGAKQSVSAVKMHGLATVLMGAGPLVMNLIPVLRMPWKDAFLMTPLHMGWMAFITGAFGFADGFQGSHRHTTGSEM